MKAVLNKLVAKKVYNNYFAVLSVKTKNGREVRYTAYVKADYNNSAFNLAKKQAIRDGFTDVKRHIVSVY